MKNSNLKFLASITFQKTFLSCYACLLIWWWFLLQFEKKSASFCCFPSWSFSLIRCVSVCEKKIHIIPRTNFAIWCNSSTPQCAGGNHVTSHVAYCPMVSDDTFLRNFLETLINKTKPGNVSKVAKVTGLQVTFGCLKICIVCPSNYCHRLIHEGYLPLQIFFSISWRFLGKMAPPLAIGTNSYSRKSCIRNDYVVRLWMSILKSNIFPKEINLFEDPAPTKTVSTYRFDGTYRVHSASLAYCKSLGVDTSLAVVDSLEEFNAIKEYMLDHSRS